jgi:hypothetical protein
VTIGPPNYGAFLGLIDAGVLTQLHPIASSLASHPSVASA